MYKRKSFGVLICLLVAALVLLSACGKNGGIYFISDGITVHYVSTSGREEIALPGDIEKTGWIFDGWITADGNIFHSGYFTDIRLNGAFFVYASWRKDTGVKGTDIKIDGASKLSGTEFFVALPNSQQTVNLRRMIVIDSASECRITLDEAGSFIAAENADLSIGTNLFYIWVSAADGQSARYRLEARRNAIFTVSYFDGGVLLLQQTVEEDSLPQPPQWTKTGFKLTWDKSLTVAVTSDLDINAVWVPNTVTVLFDGGEGAMTPVSSLCGQSILLPECGFENYGFVFAGWSDGQDNIFDEGKFFEIPATDETFITLTAVWTDAFFEVRFEPNGGNGKMESIFISANETTETNPAFTRYGYDFTGWNTAPDGSGDSYDADMLNIPFSSDAVVLYAQWTAKDVHIIFSSDAGGGERREYYIKGGSEITLPQNWYFIDGYEFVCWSVLLDKDYFYDEGATFQVPITENRIYITPIFDKIKN